MDKTIKNLQKLAPNPTHEKLPDVLHRLYNQAAAVASVTSQLVDSIVPLLVQILSNPDPHAVSFELASDVLRVVRVLSPRPHRVRVGLTNGLLSMALGRLCVLNVRLGSLAAWSGAKGTMMFEAVFGEGSLGMHLGKLSTHGAGVYVADLTPGGAAAATGGIEPGDVLWAINGERVANLAMEQIVEKLKSAVRPMRVVFVHLPLAPETLSAPPEPLEDANLLGREVEAWADLVVLLCAQTPECCRDALNSYDALAEFVTTLERWERFDTGTSSKVSRVLLQGIFDLANFDATRLCHEVPTTWRLVPSSAALQSLVPGSLAALGRPAPPMLISSFFRRVTAPYHREHEQVFAELISIAARELRNRTQLLDASCLSGFVLFFQKVLGHGVPRDEASEMGAGEAAGEGEEKTLPETTYAPTLHVVRLTPTFYSMMSSFLELVCCSTGIAALAVAVTTSVLPSPGISFLWDLTQQLGAADGSEHLSGRLVSGESRGWPPRIEDQGESPSFASLLRDENGGNVNLLNDEMMWSTLTNVWKLVSSLWAAAPPGPPGPPPGDTDHDGANYSSRGTAPPSSTHEALPWLIAPPNNMPDVSSLLPLPLPRGASAFVASFMDRLHRPELHRLDDVIRCCCTLHERCAAATAAAVIAGSPLHETKSTVPATKLLTRRLEEMTTNPLTDALWQQFGRVVTICGAEEAATAAASVSDVPTAGEGDAPVEHRNVDQLVAETEALARLVNGLCVRACGMYEVVLSSPPLGVHLKGLAGLHQGGIGIAVEIVTKGGIADKAGCEPGDELVWLCGQGVDKFGSTDAVYKYLQSRETKWPVHLRFQRGGIASAKETGGAAGLRQNFDNDVGRLPEATARLVARLFADNANEEQTGKRSSNGPPPPSPRTILLLAKTASTVLDIAFLPVSWLMRPTSGSPPSIQHVAEPVFLTAQLNLVRMFRRFSAPSAFGNKAVVRAANGCFNGRSEDHLVCGFLRLAAVFAANIGNGTSELTVAYLLSLIMCELCVSAVEMTKIDNEIMQHTLVKQTPKLLDGLIVTGITVAQFTLDQESASKHASDTAYDNLSPADHIPHASPRQALRATAALILHMLESLEERDSARERVVSSLLRFAVTAFKVLQRRRGMSKLSPASRGAPAGKHIKIIGGFLVRTASVSHTRKKEWEQTLSSVAHIAFIALQVLPLAHPVIKRAGLPDLAQDILLLLRTTIGRGEDEMAAAPRHIVLSLCACLWSISRIPFCQPAFVKYAPSVFARIINVNKPSGVVSQIDSISHQTLAYAVGALAELSKCESTQNAMCKPNITGVLDDLTKWLCRGLGQTTLDVLIAETIYTLSYAKEVEETVMATLRPYVPLLIRRLRPNAPHLNHKGDDEEKKKTLNDIEGKSEENYQHRKLVGIFFKLLQRLSMVSARALQSARMSVMFSRRRVPAGLVASQTLERLFHFHLETGDERHASKKLSHAVEHGTFDDVQENIHANRSVLDDVIAKQEKSLLCWVENEARSCNLPPTRAATIVSSAGDNKRDAGLRPKVRIKPLENQKMPWHRDEEKAILPAAQQGHHEDYLSILLDGGGKLTVPNRSVVLHGEIGNVKDVHDIRASQLIERDKLRVDRTMRLSSKDEKGNDVIGLALDAAKKWGREKGSQGSATFAAMRRPFSGMNTLRMDTARSSSGLF